LHDEADLNYYTIATLKQHAKQFEGELRLRSREIAALTSSSAVLRAFLNGCMERKTVRRLLPFFAVSLRCAFAFQAAFPFDYACSVPQAIAAADAHQDCCLLLRACKGMA
jgi:hypothetical protein